MTTREPGYRTKRAIWVIALIFGLFHLYTSGFGLLPNLQQRSIHVAFGCILTLLSMRASKRVKSAGVTRYDLVLIGLTIASILPVLFRYRQYLTFRAGFEWYEIMFSVLILVIVTECSRRVHGVTFPIMILVTLLYSLFGPYLPGMWAHGGQSIVQLLRMLYQSDLGIWGFLTGISSSIVAAFIIFGALLGVTGGGEAFIRIAYRVGGRLAGGPALVAVVSSALFGMISGSGAANVMATGVFTIPAMKKVGYRSEFAGAVEAAASTGGMVMPPMMAAVAFIMAELLGVSYIKVMIWAIVPAVLWFYSIFWNIIFEAKRIGLRPAPEEEIHPWSRILTWQGLGPVIVPVAVLIYFIMDGWTIWFACFWSFIIASLLYLFTDFKSSAVKARLRQWVGTIEKGGDNMSDIAILMAAATIVLALVNISGLGIKLVGLVMGTAAASPLMAVILTALITIVLGLGLPAAGTYIIGVAIPGMALMKLGYPDYAVHFMIFLYAALGNLTPPVGPSYFVAAGIARASVQRTGWEACRLAAPLWVLPIFIVFEPAFLLVGPITQIVYHVLLAFIGVFFIASGFGGYLTRTLATPVRVVFLLAGFALLTPYVAWHIVAGIALAAGVVVALLPGLFIREGKRETGG